MRIGIDAYPLAGQITGIGVYVYNIIKQLQRIDQKNEYFLYSNQAVNLPFEFDNRWRTYIIDGFLNKSSTFWMQTQARKALLKDKIDIFWATKSILPLNLPGSINTILTVLDLTCFYYPQTMKWDNQIIFPLFFKKSLKKAKRIIAISKTTAFGIKEFLPEAYKKVDVVYPGGAEEIFRPYDKSEAKNYICSKFKVCPKYILTVSNIEPRKNLVNLLKAYALLIKENPKFDYQLLIAGPEGWKNNNFFRVYKELHLSEEKVKFLGYITDREVDIVRLYSGADAFIFPSLYEGFGIPPLEAMACGTPVVVSDTPVFREVLADAALFADPHNPEHIASTLHKLLIDKSLAEELRQRGVARAKLFSWENAAKGILSLFNEVGSKDDNLG